MRSLYSYLRILVAGWLFVGGIALQLWSPTAAARDARQREREWKDFSSADRSAAEATRDAQDGRDELAWRVFGVLLGGAGFAVALHEAAYVGAQYDREAPGTA